MLEYQKESDVYQTGLQCLKVDISEGTSSEWDGNYGRNRMNKIRTI